MQRFKSPRQATATSGYGVIASAPAVIGVHWRQPCGSGDRRHVSSRQHDARDLGLIGANSFCNQLTWLCPRRVWLSPNVSLRPRPFKLTVPIATG
jgi:hypothetical protein